MNIRKRILASTIAGSMIGLAGCSGDTTGTQDVGNKTPNDSSSQRAFYIRAIDGYLAGATVFVDLNGNAQLDAFEPRALTDADGYVSYNHRTGTDYCAADGIAAYCLRGAIGSDEEVVIRVTGGYDTETLLPFKGMLSLRASDLRRDDMRLVTPVTSLVADTGTSAQEKFEALRAAGIFGANESYNDDPNGNAAAMSRAQITAIVSRLGSFVGEVSYGHSFQELQGRTWAEGYIATAQQFEGGVQGTFGAALSVPEMLDLIARNAIYAALYPGQTMPPTFTPPNPDGYRPALQYVAELVGLNEEMLATLVGPSTTEETTAILRLQNVVAERVFANPNDPELPDMFEWARAQLAQGNRLGSDLTALGGDDIDLSKLIDPSFDFDPNSNSISVSAKIPSAAATVFGSLVNTAFSVSVDKPDEKGDAMFFVSGSAGARSGDIDVCVRYRSNDGDFDTTSVSDPNGALLVSGRWSLLNDHTLTLNIDVAGGVRSLLLRAVGVNGSDVDYRFDFGNGLTQWSGAAPEGFTPSAIPTSDAACKTALIERFGQL
jgi:hypothetical protein